MELSSLFLALFGLFVLFFLRAYKWHRLMAAAGPAPVRKSLRSLFGGFALGLITPGRLGELGRCAFVRKEERAQVALLTVFERLLDSWALLTSVGASLFLLAPHPAAVFGVAVWLALLPVVMGFPAMVSHFATLARKSRQFRGHFTEAAAEMPRVQTPRFAVMALGAMWVELASFFFLLRAFSPTGFTAALATYPYIVLAGDLPVSFSGVGVREGAAALLLSPYAVPTRAAVSASLVWFVCAMLVPAAIGTLWLVAERAKPRRTRISDEAAPATGPTWIPLAPPQSTGSLEAKSVTPPYEVGGRSISPSGVNPPTCSAPPAIPFQ
jgi:uncharacterized membrane protein YbhN (UPF0104 family)